MQRNRKFYKKNKKKKPNYGPEKTKSSDVKNLESRTGHGFQEFKDAKTMVKYLTNDPNRELLSEFQPELFGKKKPSKKDLEQSGGHM